MLTAPYFFYFNIYTLTVSIFFCLVLFSKKNPVTEEEKEQILNQKYKETVGTFESFLKCEHSANPSEFHRCPRPYDPRYNHDLDICIYCGNEG